MPTVFALIRHKIAKILKIQRVPFLPFIAYSCNIIPLCWFACKAWTNYTFELPVNKVSEDILLGCTSLDITNHLFFFNLLLVPVIKRNTDSKELIVTTYVFFKKLMMEEVSLSLFEEETVNLFCIAFKFLKAFLIAVFMFFLHAKYFRTSNVNPVSASLLLWITDKSLCMLSFDCSKQSLTVLQIWKQLF